MYKLHDESYNSNFVPKEGQRGLLCSNKESVRCPSLGIKETLSDKELEQLELLLEDVAEIFINKHFKDLYE